MTNRIFRTGWGVALAFAVALAGCAIGTRSGTEGSVNVGLQLASGVNVDEVTYEITGNGIDLTGTLQIGNSLGTPLAAIIAGVPEGTGYTLTLTGQSTGSGSTVSCQGTATFDVVADQTTNVQLTLVCKGQQPRGTVNINGNFDLCPTLTSATASPSTVAVGDTIYVNADASDPDGDTISYAWTATAGTFADATSAATTYTCDTSGNQTLTVTADDGRGCTDSLVLNVTCGQAPPPSMCGDGVVEPPETCDGNCPTTCDDGDACTTDTMSGSASMCNVMCTHTPITSCISGDGCCPSGCDSTNDSDCVPPAVDLAGTWISHIQTTGTITAPVVGAQAANIDIIERLLVAPNGSNLDMTLQICSLDTSSSTFSVVYPASAIATFQAMTTVPAPTVNVGDAVPIPAFTIMSGWDGTNPVDSDGDGSPGISVTAMLGALPLASDVGITIDTAVTGTLTDANTITGTVSFSTNGTVFDINGAPPPGDASITVTTDQPNVDFTATRLAGDVPCSNVISMFP